MTTPSYLYPSLTYEDAAAAIDWLQRAFGFQKRLVVPGPDGGITHSELTLEGALIMVGSARPDENRQSPNQLGGRHTVLSVHVPDVDAHYTLASHAGAIILDPPARSPIGFYGYMAEDPEGHVWYFSDYRPGEYWDPPTGD